MSMRFIIRMSLLATAFLATNSQALEFGKPIKTSVVITKTNKQFSKTPLKKEIVLMNVKLTANEKRSLFNYKPTKSYKSSKTSLPPSIDLGMNEVPVLDQGMHGSCVTFALTAAIDAVIGKGDYVSQLCNLELGNTLEQKGYMPSGWLGSFGPWVLDQIIRFGVVNKENQKTKSCANVTEYPLNDFNNIGNSMSLGEFKRISEDLNEKFYPVYMMNFFERFDTHFSDLDKSEKVLTSVKESLNNGNRLTFGTFIVLSPYCSAGACATYKAKHDTWALTKEIETPPYGTGGHEMVIMGYDDDAVAVDQQGQQHQGLLVLRNSWGDDVGDNGNYYMSYDYFKKFVGEVQEIVEIKEQQ